ncbi:MAG: T9SS type A sorting domain-containing protein [Candidatus Cloacimonetes bacterium]|nr:T9SS type A sorting domain-containing protein [Candidatus Cloacimonadota bacterium]
MRFWIPIVLFFIFCGNLFSQIPDLTLWYNIRNSSYTADSQIHIRCETIDAPWGTTEIFFWQDESWQSLAMDTYSEFTLEGIIPADPENTLICRMRTGNDSLAALMPAYLENDIFPPDLNALSLISSDPSGDTLAAAPQALDLLGSGFAFSDSRFYLALQNNGNGFPTNSGGFFPSEFYFYIAGLVNPEHVLIDSVAYAFVYGNIPLVLSPGLYRISGTEISFESLQFIAGIETSIIGDMLVMSCQIDDLVDDELFGEWPSLSNSLGLDCFTGVYALPSDMYLVDYTMPALLFIDQYIIEPFINQLPALGNINYQEGEFSTSIEVEYFDFNGNFPLISEVIVPDAGSYQLWPGSFDYTQPVIFTAEIPVTGWDQLIIRFSDNGYEFSEEVVVNTSADNENLAATNLFSIFPNPCNPATNIRFELQEDAWMELILYNSRGQKVKTIRDEFQPAGSYSMLLDMTANSSGHYFCQLKTGNTIQSRKVILLK